MTVAFPQDPLGARVELDLGGVWTDVTPHVQYTQPIRVVRGRRDEAARTDPTSCAVLLRDPDGRYAPRNPHSPYYGLIGRNTPMRVSVAAGAPWLDMDGTTDRVASTPAVPALQITGDIDIRADVELTDWRDPSGLQCVVGRWGGTGVSPWLLWVRDGWIRLTWHDSSGGNWFTEAAVPDSMPSRAVIRATLDVDNGTGGLSTGVYWSDSMDGPWTVLHAGGLDGVQTLATSATIPLTAAPDDSTGVVPAAGRLYAVQVRDGIDGTVVADADFTAQTPGATAFTDTAGLDWTVKPGGLTNRAVRAVVEVPSWPWRWGRAGRMVTAQLAGAGILRRLRQGASPLDSTLRRRIPSADHLLAYWPMEDGQNATRAASGLDGGAPAKAGGLAWASDSSLGGSAPLPVINSAATLSAPVPRASTTGWHVECVYKLPTMPTTLTEILRVRVSGAAFRDAVVSASTAGVRIAALDGDGAMLAYFNYADPDAIATFSGRWNRLIVTVADMGDGTCHLLAWWPDIATNYGWAAYTTLTTGMGRVSSIIGNWSSGVSGLSIGHLSAFDVHATWDGSHHTFGTLIYDGADTGFAGETAAARYTRLTAEEDVPAIFPYGSAGTATVGPQRPGAVLDLLQDAADADVGILGEAWDRLALAYRPRVTLYNQAPALTLDYARGQVAAPLAPLDDDQQTRNDITISRPSGSSARAVADTGPLSAQAPPDGVGRYTTSLTRNVNTDDQLPDLAGWMLHLGTWDGVRYPQVTINLHESPELVTAARDLRIGDRIRIENLPVWLPPGGADLLVQAIAETIGIRTWVMTLTCTPAGPWTVGVIGGDTTPRANTAGCELAAGVGADDTTLSLTTTDGPVWVDSATYPDDFPFDLLISDGERVTCTAITGTTSPQTATVTRAVNGVSRAWDAGASVSLADRTYTAL